jgi:hypothetical protein
MVTHRKFTPEYKAQIVLEILTEGKSLSQASREHGIKLGGQESLDTKTVFAKRIFLSRIY